MQEGMVERQKKDANVL